MWRGTRTLVGQLRKRERGGGGGGGAAGGGGGGGGVNQGRVGRN